MAGFVSDLADKAASMLGGGPQEAPTGKTATPSWKKGDPIDDGDTPDGHAVAPKHPNVVDPGRPTQFVHFGYAHGDFTDKFPHDSVKDDAPNVVQSKTGSHAVMFRAALEREAILLDGFIQAVKDVLTECKKNKGAADEVIGVVSSLVGGGPKSSGPDPAQMDPYQSAAEAAGGSINKDPVKYADIHQAGVDLHQARSNYRAGVADLNAPPKDDKGDSGGLFGGALPLPSIPSLPGVSDALSVFTGILFKMFDIYQAMFLKLRDGYEQPVEEACHARSLEAIHTRYQPVFDVWSIQPPPDAPPDDGTHGPINLDMQVDEVNQVGRDINKEVNKREKQWADFWGQDPPQGPGEQYLTQALGAIKDPSEQILNGFCGALKIGDLPPFVKTAVGKITAANLGMLTVIYRRLQDPNVAKYLDESAFMGAGRQYLESVLVGVANDLLSGLTLPGPLSSIVSKDMVTKKAAAMLDDQLGAEIEPILKFAMGGLHDELTAARKAADQNKSYTMEVFLARFPLMLTLMTRNTFFPLWQMLVDKVFGDSGFINLGASPVKKMLDSGKATAGDLKSSAQDMDSDIHKKADDLSSSVIDKEKDMQSSMAKYHMNVDTPVGQAAQALGGAAKGLADKVLGSGSGGGGGGGGGAKFPGSARLNSGAGNPIKKSEWESVKPKLVNPV